MKILPYLKRYWWQICIVLATVYLQVMANLQLPDYMADIINKGIIAKDQDNIYHYGLLMLGVSIGAGVAAVIGGFFAARTAAGFARDVRHAIFTRVESFSLSEFNTFSTASLLTRSTNDIQQLQQVLVMMLRMLMIAPFIAVLALQKALQNAPNLSWIIALAVACVCVTIITLFIAVLPKFRKIQDFVDKLNLVARENLTGLRVVRAFHKESYEERKFERVNDDLTRLNLFVNRAMTIMQPLMMLIMNFTTLAIIWYGAKQVDLGSINIGNLTAFIQYSMQVVMAFLMISAMFIIVPRGVVSARRVSDVLAAEPSIVDAPDAKKVPEDARGVIEFQDVTFAYGKGSEPALSHISFTAEPGQMTAIIGGTGSGKSTLVNLIPRLFDATEGRILFDGVDVKRLTQHSLRAHIGFVPQKAVLFSGTVESNVRYGNHEATDAAVKSAVETAQARDFVEKLAKKYRSDIAQGGSNVSGGQKQRLAIARALAVKPDVYVFDDSFSALDLKTDRALRHALAPLTQDATVIIVAQRIGTILSADKIIVMDEGKIVGQGTHAELMKSSSVYREIAHSQLSNEELESLTSEESR